jgi:hypothetical protein
LLTYRTGATISVLADLGPIILAFYLGHFSKRAAGSVMRLVSGSAERLPRGIHSAGNFHVIVQDDRRTEIRNSLDGIRGEVEHYRLWA